MVPENASSPTVRSEKNIKIHQHRTYSETIPFKRWSHLRKQMKSATIQSSKICSIISLFIEEG